MALLLSTLLVYGRMNQDSEIIILRQQHELSEDLLAVFLLGLFCFLVNLQSAFMSAPKAAPDKGYRNRDHHGPLVSPLKKAHFIHCSRTW